MELKYKSSCVIRVEKTRFNCTFMELKWSSARRKASSISLVLIVPLWNWNSSQYGGVVYVDVSFNCTFMELKWRWAVFMVWTLRVLIVPLWNWNKKIVAITHHVTVVLIVPLWNWNQVPLPLMLRRMCFNCTFMELKLPLKGALSSP